PGALDSDPVTRVESGWREGPDGSQFVYVIMLARPLADGPPAAVADAASALTRRLLRSARD
ncbi:MAG: hypothetical protein K2X91_09890, partial [Thermoleophilia bacterium]|nr:hypothetical protein [Thermoleophilia bacterium]